jgi:type IV secretory pathway VirB2 component (pilin)
MLIFYYAALAIIAVSAVVTAVGLAFAGRYWVASRAPPRSEEEQLHRQWMGNLAVALILIGVLGCGVGLLFK